MNKLILFLLLIAIVSGCSSATSRKRDELEEGIRIEKQRMVLLEQQRHEAEEKARSEVIFGGTDASERVKNYYDSQVNQAGQMIDSFERELKSLQ